MDKIRLLTSNTEEIVTLEELEAVVDKQKPKAYIGFEPSGVVHLGWKICTNKIKDFLECGFDFTVLLADWHAYINDKLGGDIEKIRLCGKYMEDCFAAMGVKNVRFLYASDYISDSFYWELVLRAAKTSSVARVKRAMDIMGRKQEDAEKDLSKLFYPVMQVSDIFYLDVDVAYGGMDQRHAHMLARDIAKKIGRKPPVAVHTPLLTGLQAGGRMDPVEVKMSKSKPDSMISIHDDAETIQRKLNKAFCPEKQIEGNPVLEICRFVIFPELKGEPFLVERPERFGGDLEFMEYKELEQAFVNGLHPLDLKVATARYVNMILEPIREYFEKHPGSYEKMKEIGVIQNP
ncbi:MAG TPA: tyrosine--tRNA ligase [Thermoplasmatales archaeon]|nr:tyrosine--tRNA ligase [Thermoplasmatales archaeon]